MSGSSSSGGLMALSGQKVFQAPMVIQAPLAQALARFETPVATQVARGVIAGASEQQAITNSSEVITLLENPAHNVNQYEKLKSSLLVEEITSVIDVTVHGLERFIERGFSPDEIVQIVTKPSNTAIQSDGAKVFIQEVGANRYSFITVNQEKKEVVTALKKIDSKSLKNLGKNYGWKYEE
jgi:hypothetical protein